MNHLYHFSILAILLLSACTSKPYLGLDSDIKVYNIEFSKAINGAVDNYTILNDGTLVLKAGAKTDYFNAPDSEKKTATAPILFKEVDNTKPFTFVANVTPQFIKTYDAGAIYIFVDNDNWQKFAFEMDEFRKTRIVSVRTIKTSDDNNHNEISDSSVYMKISSDTKNIGFYYSTDNKTWNLARLYKNEYPSTIGLGLSSQSPIGEGNQTIFQEVSFTNTSVKDFRMGL